jgi:hypothetical protein
LELMEVCRLCKTQEATKKGSHLVPHFLIKRVDNVDGKLGRDYELGFAIGEFDTESYFGRAVSPEKLEEIFGELTEEEIEASKPRLVVDYYFCPHCEERLSKIESEYSKALQVSNEKNEYVSGVSSAVGLLLWASVFWRLSIHQQSGTYLSDKENETLRKFLDRFILTDISKIVQAMKDAGEDVNQMSYKLIRCASFSKDNVTHMSWHPTFRKVYSLLIDEFVVSLTVTDNYSEYEKNDFLDLNDEIALCPKNTNITQERVRPISTDKMKAANANLVKEVASQRNKRLNELWDELHVAIGGKGPTMPEVIKQKIHVEMNSEEKKMGRKHNRKEIEACTIRVVMKYEYLYNRNR